MRRPRRRSSHPRRRPWFAAVAEYLGARRALLPFLGSVLYVSAGGQPAPRGEAGRGWVLAVAAASLAYRAASPSLPGNRLGHDGQRKVGLFGYQLWLFALVLASLGPVAPEPWQDLVGVAAALVAAIVAAVAQARVHAPRGVSESLPRTPPSLRTTAVSFTLLALAFAGWESARTMGLAPGDALDPRAHDAHALSLAGGLLVLGGHAWETLRLRRLVVDAGDRALLALIAVVVAAVLGGGAMLLGQGAPDRVLRVSLAMAAGFVAYSASEGDAEQLSRLGRRGAALVLSGGPVVLLGGIAARGPGHSETAVIVTGFVALLLGSAIAYLELPLRRAEGQLLDAAARAHEALLRRDPEVSIRDALIALRPLAGASNESPELWSRVPAEVLTVDAAGYPHERPAELPPLLLEIAAEEPAATIRAELLDALVVRRPDLRSLARWMDEHGALSATLVMHDRDVEGLLVLPRGERSAPMSLEEVRAIKHLADAFAGAAAAHAALGRSLARERSATERANQVQATLDSREQADRMLAARDHVLATRLAELAPAGPYAPLARVAFEAMERRLAARAHTVIVAPAGSEVLPYLARAHLGASRSRAPLLVVEGASLAEHDLTRWTDPSTSPLALAERGVLVLRNGSRLPRDVQHLLGEAMAQRIAPWARPGTKAEGSAPDEETIDVVLFLVEQVGFPGLEPALASVVEEAAALPVSWPPLCERGEDLRALVLAGLGREGLALRGAPIGIEDAAFAKLADYEYPGDEAELRVIVQRLASSARGEVVRANDVEALGLAPESPVQSGTGT